MGGTHYVNIGYDICMLHVHLITVGSIKETYLNLGIRDFEQRIKPFINLTIHEVGETVSQGDQPALIEQALRKDTEKILRLIPKQTYFVVMDIAGKMIDSPTLATKLEQIQSVSGSLTIVIGGSHGIDPILKTKAKEKWSFSPLTFPHQLFRLMVLEQLYRVMTILHHHPYHK